MPIHTYSHVHCIVILFILVEIEEKLFQFNLEIRDTGRFLYVLIN